MAPHVHTAHAGPAQQSWQLVTYLTSLLFPGLLARGYDPSNQGTVSLASVPLRAAGAASVVFVPLLLCPSTP